MSGAEVIIPSGDAREILIVSKVDPLRDFTLEFDLDTKVEIIESPDSSMFNNNDEIKVSTISLFDEYYYSLEKMN